MDSDGAANRRYEGIYRVIRRTSNRGLWLCLATTGILALIYGIWLARPIAEALAGTGLPPWILAGVQAAASLSILLTLPNLVQLIVIHGDTAAAMEAFNAYGFAELKRRQQEGVQVPTLRSAAQVQPWVTVHPEVGGPLLVRLLVWASDYQSAMRALERIHPVTAADGFEVELLRAMVQFVEAGQLDLSHAHHALTAVTGVDHDWARLALAFEQARADHAAGLPWQAPLAIARREVAIPLAATFLGRLLSSVRAYATITVILTMAAILFTLLR
jgi:hypothetical protein